MLQKSIFEFFKKNELGFWKSFLLGFLISATGSAMIGALHLIAIQINIEQGLQAALLFSSGCAFMEAVFVRYIVPFTDWLSKKKNAIRIMEIVLLILFVALSIACFYGAMSAPKNIEGGIIPSFAIPTFFLGMGIRIIYPSMIPFWLAWNTVLVTRKIKFQIMPFVVASGVATVLMHALYIFTGLLLIEFLKDKGQWMLALIGVLFLVTTLFQVKRMYKS